MIHSFCLGFFPFCKEGGLQFFFRLSREIYVVEFLIWIDVFYHLITNDFGLV